MMHYKNTDFLPSANLTPAVCLMDWSKNFRYIRTLQYSKVWRVSTWLPSPNRGANNKLVINSMMSSCVFEYP